MDVNAIIDLINKDLEVAFDELNDIFGEDNPTYNDFYSECIS